MNIKAFKKDTAEEELKGEISAEEESPYLEQPLDLAGEIREGSEEDHDLSKSRRPGKKTIIITSAVAFVLVAAICVSLYFISCWRNGDMKIPPYLQNYEFINTGKYFEGMSINGVSIAGLTKSEAEKKAKDIEGSLVKEFTLEINANGKTEVLTQDSFNFSYTTSNVLKDVDKYRQDVIDGKTENKPKDFIIERVLIEDSVDLAIDNLAITLNIIAVNSQVTNLNGSYYYSQGQKGSEIDKQDLRTRIIEFINSGSESGSIDAVVTEVEPITINAQDETGEVTVLSTFSTISTNNANGNHNMALALKACDGSVIRPGEVWSFNAHTGNSNLESLGYKPATVIMGGKYDTGVGGGICQASTTIYNAALYAGLEIAERHCHLWASSYAKAGLDATIDYPRLDLKLKNSGNTPVYLKCSMSGNKLTVTIFGHKTDEYDTIKLNSKTTQYVEGDYYRVAATRKFYKNGAVVKTENLTSSKYSLKKPAETGGSSSTVQTDSPASQPSASSQASSVVSSSQPSSSVPSSSQAPSISEESDSSSSSEVSSSEPTQETPPDASEETLP